MKASVNKFRKKFCEKFARITFLFLVKPTKNKTKHLKPVCYILHVSTAWVAANSVCDIRIAILLFDWKNAVCRVPNGV